MDIISEFESKMDAFLSWRKKELIIAQSLVDTHDGEQKNYLIRAWVTLIYAHCEKFLIETAKISLTYLHKHSPDKTNASLLWLISNKAMLKEDDKKYCSYIDYTKLNYDDLLTSIGERLLTSRKESGFKYSFLIRLWTKFS